MESDSRPIEVIKATRCIASYYAITEQRRSREGQGRRLIVRLLKCLLNIMKVIGQNSNDTMSLCLTRLRHFGRRAMVPFPYGFSRKKAPVLYVADSTRLFFFYSCRRVFGRRPFLRRSKLLPCLFTCTTAYLKLKNLKKKSIHTSPIQ